jgi:uncharacterized membrane protein YdjX (TVP38/TMEM64 family)
VCKQLKNSVLKLIFGGLWLSLFLFALFCWWQSAIALTSVPSLLQEGLDNVGLLNAALIYIVLYAIRPLILFPATLLTIASGLIFGPWLGTLFTIIGENASANFGFALARWFGRESVVTRSTPLMSRWDEKLKQNGIVSVMTMRLIMLPFDAVAASPHQGFTIALWLWFSRHCLCCWVSELLITLSVEIVLKLPPDDLTLIN